MFDNNDNFLNQYAGTLQKGQTQTCLIRVDCLNGRTLKATAAANLTIEGRLNGVGSYVNLVSSSIDLSTWNGTRQTFQIRLTAAAGTTAETVAFDLRII